MLTFYGKLKKEFKGGGYTGRRKNNTLRAYYNKTRNNWFVPFPIKDYQTNEITIHKKYFNSKEEADEQIKQFEYKKGNKIYIENNGIPIYKLMEYLNERKFRNKEIQIGQYGYNKKIIEKIAENSIGKKDISTITFEDLEDYFNTLIKYSQSYMDDWIAQFTQAFKYAEEQKLIPVNPMYNAHKPKSSKKVKKVRALELEEQKILTEYLTHKTIIEEPYKNAFLIQMYMGLRIGEVLGLMRDDVDFKNNVIHIRRTLKCDDNGRVYIGDTTKTPAGVRDVPIPKKINKFVKEQFDNSVGNQNNLLFLNKNGGISNERNVGAIFKRIVINNLKTNDLSTHSLRHTFGTRCIEAGMSPVVVKKVMGHERIEITLNVYVSTLDNFRNNELEKLNNYYNNTEIFNIKEDMDMEF